MADEGNMDEQGAEGSDDESTEVVTKKKAAKRAPKKVKEPKVKEPKEPKPPKEKVVRAGWQPEPALEALVEQMKGYARAGDRRACAFIVKMSLDVRNLCKATLDSGEGLPSSEDDVDGPETLDAVAVASDADDADDVAGGA